jgi:hypothetical protein
MNSGEGDMRSLTKANGCLVIKEFEAAMNPQVQENIRRKLSKHYSLQLTVLGHGFMRTFLLFTC